MRAAAARWVASGIAAGTVTLLIAGLALAYADRNVLPARLTRWDFVDVSGNLVSLAVPAVGVILAYKRPANRIGWLLLAVGLGAGLWDFWESFAHHALVAAHGSVWAGRALAWLASGILAVAVGLLAFVFVLFPDGTLRSRRWRPAAWFVGGAFTLAAAALLVNGIRFWSDPFSSAQNGSTLDAAAALLILAGLLA